MLVETPLITSLLKTTWSLQPCSLLLQTTLKYLQAWSSFIMYGQPNQSKDSVSKVISACLNSSSFSKTYPLSTLNCSPTVLAFWETMSLQRKSSLASYFSGALNLSLRRPLLCLAVSWQLIWYLVNWITLLAPLVYLNIVLKPQPRILQMILTFYSQAKVSILYISQP
jgi:hypothetical protein